MQGTDAQIAVPFTIDFTDIATNAGTQVTATIGGSSVMFDKNAPTLTTLNKFKR